MKQVIHVLYHLSMAAILIYLANHFLGFVIIPKWVVYTILIVGAISFFANAMIRRSELKKRQEDEQGRINE